jgi:ABC-2 type transport system permease protein
MVRDAWIMLRYQTRMIVREPVWVVTVMIQPLLYMLLFAPLLQPIAETRGFPPGDTLQVFVPGLLVQLGIFGSLFVGFGIVLDMRHGTLERMQVTPASRLGLLLGRIIIDTIVVALQSALLTAVAVAFGLRVPLAGALVALALVVLLGLALTSISYAAGLWLKSHQLLAQLLNTVSLPLLLLSGILLPMTLAPTWLLRLSQVNPLSHVVDAARAAFRADYGDPSLAAGVACAAGLAVAGLWIAERMFRRESA